MTRINAGVPPKYLSDKHLIAEHREIKRIPNTIKSGRAKLDNIPENFTLGKGHVKFFYNKLQYLLDRYISIYEECIHRGFKVQNYSGAWNDLPVELFGNFTPTDSDRYLILNRILENEIANGMKTISRKSLMERDKYNALASERQKLDFMVKNKMIQGYSDLKIDMEGIVTYKFVSTDIV